MKISVILGHPYQESFNHAIAQTAVKALREKGHEVIFHDLFQEGFDPVIQSRELIQDDISFDKTVEKHCREIKEADGIIIVHPNWWGQPPAILKGWIDRVLRPGVAYAFETGDLGGGIPKGLLKARMAIVFNTSNTPVERENDIFGDPLETIWRNCIFDYCGVKGFYRKMFRVISDSTILQRQEWLKEVEQIITVQFN